MSDNSFSSFPPPQNRSQKTSVSVPSSKLQNNQTPQIEIIKIPRDLKSNNAKPQRIEGQVVRSDPNTNRITVRTSRGDVELQLPRDQAPPPKNTSVELRIVTNTNQRITAEIRTLPQTTPVNPDQVQVKTPQTQQPAPTQYKAPSHVPQGQTTPTPEAGQPIRLQPLLPTDIPKIQTALPTQSYVRTALLPITSLTSVSAPISQNPLTVQITNASQAIPNTLNFAGVQTPQTANAISLNIPQNISVAVPLQIPVSTQPLTTHNIFSTNPTSSAPNSFNTLLATAPHNAPFITAPNAEASLQSVLQQPSSGIINGRVTPDLTPAKVVGFINQQTSVLSITSFSPFSAPQLFSVTNTQLPLYSEFLIPTAKLPATTITANSTLPTTGNQLFQISSWPALQEMMELLFQSNPVLAQQITNLMPSVRTPAQIPTSLLLFLTAVRGGDISAWIGDKPFEALRRVARSDIANRIASDFSNISRASSEALPNDWRGMTIPFQGQTELQNMALYYKNEDQTTEKNEKKQNTRFLFDMTLSRMGNLQIDGLFKTYEKITRLDIVLRSETSLSQLMKQTLRQNYSKILRAQDMLGDIQFQDTKETFIKIFSDENTGHENVKFTT